MTAAAAPAGDTAHEVFASTSTQLLKDMDREKARAGFLRVVQLDDNYGPAWFNLGVLAEAAGDWTEAKLAATADRPKAIALLRDAVSGFREADTPALEIDARLALAELLLACKQKSQAESETLIALNLSPAAALCRDSRRSRRRAWRRRRM